MYRHNGLTDFGHQHVLEGDSVSETRPLEWIRSSKKSRTVFAGQHFLNTASPSPLETLELSPRDFIQM
jgi:hypothetical protein